MAASSCSSLATKIAVWLHAQKQQQGAAAAVSMQASSSPAISKQNLKPDFSPRFSQDSKQQLVFLQKRKLFTLTCSATLLTGSYSTSQRLERSEAKIRGSLKQNTKFS